LSKLKNAKTNAELVLQIANIHKKEVENCQWKLFAGTFFDLILNRKAAKYSIITMFTGVHTFLGAKANQ